MHSYYMKDIEDRLLVERLLNTCLVPFGLESTDRMKKLFLLFTTIDEYATKAFIGIQKGQKQARKVVSELLEKLKEKNDWKDKEVQMKIHTVSQFLPNPLKAQEFLKKLANHLLSDQIFMNAMDKIVNDQDISCRDCTETVVSQIYLISFTKMNDARFCAHIQAHFSAHFLTNFYTYQDKWRINFSFLANAI